MALRPQVFTNGNLVEKHINTAYDNVKSVADSLDDVIAVANGLVDLTTVAGDIGNVVVVATDIANVNTVATDINSGKIDAAIAAVISTAADLVNVQSIYDQFDDRYLGDFAVDPTVDNDGAVLLTGSIYWNTGDNTLRVYNGAAWQSPTTEAADSALAALTSQNEAATSAAAALVSENNSAATYDLFDDRILGAFAVSPTLDNDGDPILEGAMYWDTVLKVMRAYTGTIWQAIIGSSTAEQFEFTCTTGQTVFSGLDDHSIALAYVAGFIVPMLNGRQLAFEDYTADDGSTFTLTTGVGIDAGDILQILAFGTFDIADTYSIAGANAAFVNKTSATGAAEMPSGTTAQRDGVPRIGDMRHNTDFNRAEEYTSSGWKGLGGATGAGGDAVFYENAQTVTTDYTITSGQNAMTAGVITIDTGVTVTVPTGSTWSIV